MNYKVYKKHVNKYTKPKIGEPATNHTQSVYLFSGRAITPDKTKVINVKKNVNAYGRPSGASTDRSHLNRNLSLTAISGSATSNPHSRNIHRTKELKSKGSLSSNSMRNNDSSFNHASNSKIGICKTSRRQTEASSDKGLTQNETIKFLKNDNKRLTAMYKENERVLTEKLKESRREMEKMTTIINQLWPFLQSHLKRELGSEKIANLKRMAKEESRITFLETLSKVIAKVKKDAEKEGRSLFGTDGDSKYEKLKLETELLEQAQKEMRAKLMERELNDAKAKEIIDKLKSKVKELDAFRLTTTDFVMTKATSQEEILFLVRANERISAFQEKDLIEDDEKFEDGGFITKQRHYEVLDDYEPAPSFLKALTNEILYLDHPEEESLVYQTYSEKLFSEGYNPSQASLEKHNESTQLRSFSKIQKIDSTDQMPSLIKDTLVEIRNKLGQDSYDVDEEIPSFGSRELKIKMYPKTSRVQKLNSTTEYGRSDPMMLTSDQYDKLGMSLDADKRSLASKVS
jgi:hypothetical protein